MRTAMLIHIMLAIGYAGEPFSVTDLKIYLDRKEIVYEQISIQMGEAYWNMYTDDERADLNTPKQRFYELFADDTLRQILDYWSLRRDEINDPVLKRRIAVWSDILIGAKVNYDEEIFTLQSQLEDWMDIEEGETDTPSPEKITQAVLQLMQFRNEKSKELGYANYAAMMLEITEVGVNRFERCVAIVDSMTKAPYQRLVDNLKKEKKKDKLNRNDVFPLVIDYYNSTRGIPIEQRKINSIVEKTVENIGIDYDKLPLQFEENVIPKGIGGQGIAVKIPEDFRAVLNLNQALNVHLHELGHGLQWMHTTINIPILEEYEWCWGSVCPAYAEGMAETMVRFINHPLWMKKYGKMNEKEIAANRATMDSCAAAWFRYQLTLFLFEYELYQNLSQTPEQIWNSLYQQYLAIDFAPEKPFTLDNIIYVSYPIYIQNYLLGDIIAWQVHAALAEKFGEKYIFNKKVSRYMIDHLWKDGALLDWQSRLRNATGKELDVVGYLKMFGF